MTIEVHTGDIAVSSEGETLTSSGIGSCVIVTFFDKLHGVGGLAHTMLPSRTAKQKLDIDKADYRFVDLAIDGLLLEMRQHQSQPENLQAKLIGGANMFANIKSTTGEDIATSVRDKLSNEGIEIVAECLGGHQGRSIEFSTKTGMVIVKVML